MVWCAAWVWTAPTVWGPGYAPSPPVLSPATAVYTNLMADTTVSAARHQWYGPARIRWAYILWLCRVTRIGLWLCRVTRMGLWLWQGYLTGIRPVAWLLKWDYDSGMLTQMGLWLWQGYQNGIKKRQCFKKWILTGRVTGMGLWLWQIYQNRVITLTG